MLLEIWWEDLTMTNALKHSLIESYLNNLNKNLQLLPHKERELHITEVKDHLYQTINEKRKVGIDIQQAVEETLQEFLSPEELASGIMNEEYENKSLVNKSNAFFNYGLMLTIGSFGGLSVPILKGTIDLGIILPFILSMLVGIILLNSKNIQWNENQLKNIKWASRILIGFSSVPLTFFSIRIIKDNSINFTILIYLITIIILLISTFLFTKKMFDKKQINNY